MTELSGFSAAQPLAQLGPQSLRLPTSMAEVCECADNCGASRILKGLAQIVGTTLTNLIQVEIKSAATPEGVKVDVIPWKADGVERNGLAIPGGWVVVDGSEVVGMGNDEYAGRWSQNLPLEWNANIAAEIDDGGAVKLTFPQPTSANRPFSYTVTRDGQNVPVVGIPVVTGSTVMLALGATLAEGEPAAAFALHVGTQYQGVEAEQTVWARIRVGLGLNGERDVLDTRYYEYSPNGSDWIITRSVAAPEQESEGDSPPL